MKPWNIRNVITEVSTKFGAPMGRYNKGSRPENGKVYCKWVRLIDGYDIGGAYWGIGAPLYVEFTPDLSYINFERQE